MAETRKKAEGPQYGSDDITELAQALLEVVRPGMSIRKGRKANVGSYSYSYADLGDVVEVIGPRLTDQGVLHLQPIQTLGDKSVVLTMLIHAKSGQWLSSSYPLKEYGTPQEQGSAITYARRYALCSMLGIVADDDDDGQAAQKASKQQATVTTMDPLKAKRVSVVKAAKDNDIPPEVAARLLGEWFGEGKTSKDLDANELDSAAAGLARYGQTLRNIEHLRVELGMTEEEVVTETGEDGAADLGLLSLSADGAKRAHDLLVDRKVEREAELEAELAETEDDAQG